MEHNRIYFLQNPWPNGHKIIEFVWSGYLSDDGDIWFDFHLKTEKYYADDPEYADEELIPSPGDKVSAIDKTEPINFGTIEVNSEDLTDDTDDESDTDDWNSKIVWGNYHQCTLSSTYWGSDGILLDTSQQKLDFAKLPALMADSMPLADDWEYDDLAFNIYLLGHDSCANHMIKITKNENNSFDVIWTGNIAQSYVGDDEFKHSFELSMQSVKFDGFDYPQEMSQAEALAAFSQHLANVDDFEFVDLNSKSFKREYKLALKS